MIGYSGGVTNYLINYDLFLFPLYPFGNYTICLYVILIGFSILRYRFIDIEVIVKRTLVFAGLFAMVMGVVAIVMTVMQRYVGQYLKVSPLISTGISVMLAIIAYDPTRKVLVKVTDRYLFQKRQDIKVILNKLSRSVVTILDMNQIGERILETLEDSLRLEAGAIVIRDEKYNYYRVLKSFGLEDEGLYIRADSPFSGYFCNAERIVNLEVPDERDRVPQEVREWLGALKAVIAIPLFVQNELIGVLALGKKKSDQEFGQDEMDYFPTVASQVAIALSNARLFEAVLEERASKIKAQNEAKMVSYARTIGHEIKNALVGIEGPAVFLQQHQVPDLKKMYERFVAEQAPSGAQKKYLDICERVDQQAKDIFERVQKIRVIASTAQGTLKTSEDEFEEIYFKILWESVKEEFAPRRCRFESHIPDNFVIYGNLVLLQRVFINLVNNALDAMPADRECKIELRADYGERDSGKFSRIEVRDNGSGIPSEMIGRIFEQGFSTKPKPVSTNMEASGHGQGLFVSREVVEAIHQGKLEVESAPGTGTAFVIWLPVRQKARAEGVGT